MVVMNYVLGLKCINCGRELEAEKGIYTCPACGSKDGILDVVYDYQAIKKEGMLLSKRKT
jgi:threonine synthase